MQNYIFDFICNNYFAFLIDKKTYLNCYISLKPRLQNIILPQNIIKYYFFARQSCYFFSNIPKILYHDMTICEVFQVFAAQNLTWIFLFCQSVLEQQEQQDDRTVVMVMVNGDVKCCLYDMRKLLLNEEWYSTWLRHPSWHKWIAAKQAMKLTWKRTS